MGRPDLPAPADLFPPFTAEEEAALRPVALQPAAMPKLWWATADSDGTCWFAGNHLYPNGWTATSLQRRVLLDNPRSWWQFHGERALATGQGVLGTGLILLAYYIAFRVAWWALLLLASLLWGMGLEP
eukprot:TRINITY_DN9154_c0_g1_i1.p1 TRINITY_DN9154_c0_g1~~TRINITY_DN9154_c0_g1_i1.p1  ORF type:complete len:128 (-),score=27.13 TRINITY_DN9154_c0_g1_i1:179-562(-)